ncbi:MAG: molybdopterin converting factor subunit 1 [Alphaproteobacteria bacterium]|nr:molybdopterin converting factor subunit 1 [Alphaproteobacteria bacterium]
MRVLYFARVRQIVGRGEDQIEIPDSVATVGDLADFLAKGDAGCAAAFADRRTLKAAVDKSHASFETSIKGAREVAFFPPVTGG